MDECEQSGRAGCGAGARRFKFVRRESQIPAAELLCDACAGGSRLLTRSPALIASGLCDIVDRNRHEDAWVASDRAGLVADPNHILDEEDRPFCPGT